MLFLINILILIVFKTVMRSVNLFTREIFCKKFLCNVYGEAIYIHFKKVYVFLYRKIKFIFHKFLIPEILILNKIRNQIDKNNKGEEASF